MPPPLSSNDSAPNTSSTSGLRLVRSTGITAPSASRPVSPDAVASGAVAGVASSTYFSPSRLDWRSRATASAGSTTSPLTATVTSAVHPSAARPMFSTRPTGTSLTLTPACGTRSSTSLNRTVTR